jgi:hypothetical protein
MTRLPATFDSNADATSEKFTPEGVHHVESEEVTLTLCSTITSPAGVIASSCWTSATPRHGQR